MKNSIPFSALSLLKGCLTLTLTLNLKNVIFQIKRE
jgi:hypothetical protein